MATRHNLEVQNARRPAGAAGAVQEPVRGRQAAAPAPAATPIRGQPMTAVQMGYNHPIEMLCKFAYEGDVAQLQQFLDPAFELLDLTNASGQSPLQCAAMKGKIEAADALLRSGHKLNVRDPNGWCPLMAAVCYNQVDMVRFLLEHGALKNMMLALQAPPAPEITSLLDLPAEEHLCNAAMNGRDFAVHLTVTANPAMLCCVNSQGKAPLYCAARGGHVLAIQALLSAGADINVKIVSGGSTPLHGAAYGNHLAAVRCLVDNGAWLFAQNKDRALPEQDAESPEVKQLIQSAMTEISRFTDAAWNGDMAQLHRVPFNSSFYLLGRNQKGQDALYCAARQGHIACARALIDAGANVNGQNPVLGSTALHGASFSGHVDMCRYLLSKGANPSIKNRVDQGYTPLQEAQNPEIQRMLQEAMGLAPTPFSPPVAVYPPQTGGYPQDGMYPPVGGYPGMYPPQAGGYPPVGGYPPQPGGYPQFAPPGPFPA